MWQQASAIQKWAAGFFSVSRSSPTAGSLITWQGCLPNQLTTSQSPSEQS